MPFVLIVFLLTITTTTTLLKYLGYEWFNGSFVGCCLPLA